MVKLYNVCNDYSLTEVSTEAFEKETWSQYRTRPNDVGVLFIHKEHNEVHYLLAPAGLEGRVLPW